jgi:hypothetical protein
MVFVNSRVRQFIFLLLDRAPRLTSSLLPFINYATPFVNTTCLLDHETAASAVRNLNNTDVGGCPLRIDLADSDPFLEGKTTVRGELLDGGFPGPSEPRSQSPTWYPSAKGFISP